MSGGGRSWLVGAATAGKRTIAAVEFAKEGVRASRVVAL